MIYLHTATIKHNKIIFKRPDIWLEDVKSNEGKEVIITIKQPEKNRSDRQNRYLWGVVYKIISDETGHDINELHEFFLIKKYGTKTTNIMGINIEKRAKSSRFNTKQFTEYIDFVRKFGAMELGLNIPSPDEVDYNAIPFYN